MIEIFAVLALVWLGAATVESLLEWGSKKDVERWREKEREKKL
jgi:hypothetical protein